MRLELTISKEIIKNKFNIEDRYNNSRSRLNNHVLILSDELLEIWEADAKEKNYQQQFENWYFSLVGSAKKLKRVNIREDWQRGSQEEYIIAETAAASQDKIVVGEVASGVKKFYKQVYFVKESIFNKNKSHTIRMGEIKDVWDKAVLDHIFDIYETPIRIDIRMGNDATVLGEYLSIFYKNSKNITIKDTYIHKSENEHNLNKYVLKYIDKKNTHITFRAYWNQKIKEELIEKFTNYNGYHSNVVIENKKRSHDSFIESDEYIIDLGYRLRAFGDKDDDKTEEETITITKK